MSSWLPTLKQWLAVLAALTVTGRLAGTLFGDDASTYTWVEEAATLIGAGLLVFVALLLVEMWETR